MKTKNRLDYLRVASPCPMNWEQMTGNDRVRFCDQCSLNVYNIAEMSRSDADDLIANIEGRVCVRLFRRVDGTIITKDCPIGLRAIRRRVAKTTAAVFATVAGICATVFPQRTSRANLLSTTAGGNSLSTNFVAISASLSGEINDPNGKGVSGATLTLTNLQTNQKRVIKSNKKGRYHFVVSEFGLYRLRVEASYFSPFEQELELHLNDDVRRDVFLDVGGTVGVVVIDEPRKIGFDLSGVHIRIN
jgi:hypothetical protein